MVMEVSDWSFSPKNSGCSSVVDVLLNVAVMFVNFSSIFNWCVLHNLCLPWLVTIDLFEHVPKDFALGGWRRNEFEFVGFLV